MNFENQVAIITGSGRGIGAAYAEELAHRGASVIVHDRGVAMDGTGNDTNIAKNQADKITKQGGKAVFSTVDINTRDGCYALIDQSIKKFGRVDILIHNAGWVSYQSITELTPDFLHRATAIQLEAPVWLAQAVWPYMQKQKYGRIVLTTSCRAIYKEYTQPGLVAYAATKMSQIGIMNVLAVEGENHGILVNTVSPVAKTRMWGVNREPLDLKPESIATGVLYLASQECKDSGWVLRSSNDQFHATRSEEAEGVDYPIDINAIKCKTPEEVMSNWHKIAFPSPEPR